jgi:hypothetical protein
MIVLGMLEWLEALASVLKKWIRILYRKIKKGGPKASR